MPARHQVVADRLFSARVRGQLTPCGTMGGMTFIGIAMAIAGLSLAAWAVSPRKEESEVRNRIGLAGLILVGLGFTLPSAASILIQ